MARNSRLHAPDRPCGLLEPCAATSGKHGSEEGGAGKRRPLSDDRLHWVRDMAFDEDRSQVRTATGPRMMASLRNLVITILRLSGAESIAAALRYHARQPSRPLRTMMKC